MEYINHIVAIFAVVFLAAGWVVVQLLARKAKTKNHIDNFSGCGNQCSCTNTEDCKN